MTSDTGSKLEISQNFMIFCAVDQDLRKKGPENIKTCGHYFVLTFEIYTGYSESSYRAKILNRMNKPSFSHYEYLKKVFEKNIIKKYFFNAKQGY